MNLREYSHDTKIINYNYHSFAEGWDMTQFVKTSRRGRGKLTWGVYESVFRQRTDMTPIRFGHCDLRWVDFT